MRVSIKRIVAAVNEFFAGLAALLSLIAALAGAAVYAGQVDVGNDQPPTDEAEALCMLKRLHCHCTEDFCSACCASQLPTFVEDASQEKIECCRTDDIFAES